MKVKLSNVRLAFPALFKANTLNDEGEPRYSATFIFPPEHPCVAEIEMAINQFATEKRGRKPITYLSHCAPGYKFACRMAMKKQDPKATPVINLYRRQ